MAPTATWAGFAAHALRPGGVLLTRAASAHRAEVLPQLAVEGLGYCWIVVCCEPDGRTQVNARKVTTFWRPWLVYTRSGGRPDRHSADYFAAADAEAAKTATAIEAMIRRGRRRGGHCSNRSAAPGRYWLPAGGPGCT